MKTEEKVKIDRGIRRQVDLDLGVKPPKTYVFTSKKLYSRKLKHKKNENN